LVLAESATILPDVLTFDLDLQEVVFGDTACLTVTAETTSGSPVPGVTITFDTQAGSLNHPLSLSDTTDASGVAQDCYSYDGSSGAGTDEWVASVGGVTSNSAFVDWISPNSPPDVSGAVPSVACTSGPGKALIDISILGLSDPDGDALTVVITGITSDERTHRNGGDPAPDGFGVGTDTASVRDQRFGSGDGRVYEISFTASDGVAAPVPGSVFVSVPHDKSPPADPCSDAVNTGQIYDATQIN
jgi:hypothetical protein